MSPRHRGFMAINPYGVISNEERNLFYRGLRTLPTIGVNSRLGRFLLPLVVEMTTYNHRELRAGTPVATVKQDTEIRVDTRVYPYVGAYPCVRPVFMSVGSQERPKGEWGQERSNVPICVFSIRNQQYRDGHLLRIDFIQDSVVGVP